ncbi:MAG: Protein-glutamate O-methyltransferase CheR [Candidatus Thermoplasmatota archaeon]|nr:Protein-glutamate O-methyltransferase CheR [Candidatus Thermoplasmatota archaeon]
MEDSEAKAIESVRQHLKRSRGLDISGYSSTFVLRSLRKRVGRSRANDLPDYLRLVRSSEEETTEFIGALSINVTDFFRDAGAFEALSEKVIRPVIKSKVGTGGIVRIWSAGCATGQELYTLAMCLEQELRRTGNMENIIGTVTGGDLSKSAIAFARKGVYTKEQVKNVPPQLLLEYFDERDEKYEVGDRLRRRVRFVNEDLLSEPVSRFFDIVVCRNVLIYFSRTMHDQVVMNLHRSLRPNGYLMLGRTESLLGSPRLHYDLMDAENRIFKKKE